MNNTIIDNWNKYIKKDDIVYHLGDFFLGSKFDLKDIVDRLNGTIYLIRGNHDRLTVKSYEDCGIIVLKNAPIIMDDYKIMLSHRPLPDIYKYCTKPELEMLLISNEGLEKEYEKVKSNMSPKDFAKKNISYNRKKYNQSSKFLEEYFGGANVINLIESIKKYKLYKKHNKKDELYLADLLK